MSDPEITPTAYADFAEQMQTLTSEAERKLAEQHRRETAPAPAPNYTQMLRPLLLGIQALGRATEENTQKLERVAEAVAAQGDLPGLLTEVRDTMHQKHSINQQLFDALHAELKGYKDGFLLEVLQKPIVLDLIALFDDLEQVSRQVSEFARDENPEDGAHDTTRAGTLSTNLEHTLGALLEVLERMEVTKLEPSTGKHLDKAAHRAVRVELADTAEQDGEIAESLKSGFMWKDRLLRPEEVAIRKFKEGYLTMIPPEPQASQP